MSRHNNFRSLASDRDRRSGPMSLTDWPDRRPGPQTLTGPVEPLPCLRLSGDDVWSTQSKSHNTIKPLIYHLSANSPSRTQLQCIVDPVTGVCCEKSAPRSGSLHPFSLRKQMWTCNSKFPIQVRQEACVWGFYWRCHQSQISSSDSCSGIHWK